MAKPKEVHVSLYDTGKGELHVWGISLKITGSLPRVNKTLCDGSTLSLSDARAIARKEKQIQKLIEALDIPDE